MPDYSIALGVKPLQLEDPLTTYNKFATLQNAQNQNALAQYQLSAAQREDAATNALNAAYRDAYNTETGDIDLNKLRQSLSTGGFGSKLPAIEKSISELKTQKLTQSKTETELIDKKLNLSRGFLDTIDPSDPDAPRQYLAWHEANHKDPVLGPLLASRGVTADQARARIMDAVQKGPQAFAQLINMSKLGAEKFIEQNKPQVYTQNTGNETRLVSVPGLGGAATAVPGSTASMQLTPGDLAQQARPVSVAANATLVNPSTGAEIFKGPSAPTQEPTEPTEVRLLKALGLPVTPEGLKQLKQAQTVTSEEPKDALIRQYEYAKTQGYGGTLLQFKRTLAEAGRPISTSSGGGGSAAPLERAFDTKTNSQVFVDRSQIRADPERYKPLGAEEKLKPIPQTVNQALTGNASSLSQIKKAIDAATENPNAIGLKGNLPQTILNKTDPKGVETRALITEIGSALVHDRSGAAVAASERPTLVPFIPQATDDSETAIKKLKKLKEKIQAEQNGILDFYSEDQGYKPSLYHKQQNTPAEPAAPSSAKPTAVNIGALPPKVTKNGKTYVLQPNGKYIEQ
jgi:hypothetical protein